MSNAPVIRNISARMLRELITQQTTTLPAVTTSHTFSPEFRQRMELLVSHQNTTTTRPRTVALRSLFLKKKNKETFLGPRVLVLESEDTCAICMDDVKEGDEVRTIGCDHTFHSKCISKWVERKETCPLCRFDMCSISNGRKRMRT